MAKQKARPEAHNCTTAHDSTASASTTATHTVATGTTLTGKSTIPPSPCKHATLGVSMAYSNHTTTHGLGSDVRRDTAGQTYPILAASVRLASPVIISEQTVVSVLSCKISEMHNPT